MSAVQLLCAAALCIAPVLAQSSAQVRVAVSVREGTRPVTGLAAEDFVLTDNDVPQRIEVHSIDAVPFDVTLVVDTKNSVTSVADALSAQLQQIARVLRKGDALRVIRVDAFVEEIRPLTPALAAAAPIAPFRPSVLASFHDALVAALVARAIPERLPLVVAVTDAVDSMSVTSADRVREIAARADAVLEIVTVRPSPPANPAFVAVRPRFRDANVLVLTEAAEQTGGQLRTPGLFADADLFTSFRRVFDDLRQGYLLSYVPTQVERAGWHELSVTAARAPNATLRVRRGYHAR